MKKLVLFVKLSFTLAFITETQSSFSQIVVNTAATPTQMVTNLVGPGITFSNVTFTGDQVARGIFNSGNTTNLGMTSGVVLTTGDANLVPINNSGSSGIDNAGQDDIVELQGIAQTNIIRDGATLEFDFIPLSNNLNVRYIFGSDEYLEWVNAGFNDAFAFYISGPGIVGQQNIATVAGQPVTIDNINTTSNPGSYVNNPYVAANPLPTNRIEYDGFTTVLLATRAVIPCSTYHIKLMIADGGDAIYDSGVFIEENGFYSSGAITDVAVQPAYGFGTGVEGCVGSQFVFTMPAALGTNTTFNYTVGGTATSGVDYVPIPTSVTIPAGQTVATVPVNILNDALTEGAETITITVQISPCSTQTFTLTINDPTPINVNATNAAFCQGQGPVNITANATGGNGTITYSWNNGAGNGTPVSVNPAAATTYTVTATDQCGRSNTANSTVTVTPLPTSTFTVTSPVCTGSPSTVTYTGNASVGATYNWNFGGGTAAPGGTTQGPHNVTWAAGGNYNVTLTVNDNGCNSTPSTQNVTVNPTPATPTVGSNSPVCTGSNINLTANTIAGATYVWTGPNGFTSALEDPTIPTATAAAAGTYNLYVVIGSCTSLVASTNVVVNPMPAAPTIGSNSPVCSGNPLNLTANTVAGATYVWTGPNGFTSALEDPSLNPATVAMSGNYSLYLVTANCTSATATIPVVVNATPAAPVIASNTPVCSGNTINLTSNTIAGATYNWTGPGGFTSALEDPTRPSATVAMGGNYSLYVSVNNCTSATATTPVVVNATPAAPVVASNSPVCSGNPLNLTSNTIAGATYNWTGPGGFTSALEDPSLNPSTVAMSGNYNMYVSVNNCTSATATVAVVVNPTPATPVVASNSPVCSGNPINLTANTIAGVTYSWTGPNAFTSSAEDPTIASATVAMAGNYNLNVSTATCTSATATVAVVVNQTPAAPVIGSNSPVCAGGTLNLTANTIAGATYSWTGPGGFTSAAEDPTRPNATVAMTGNYSLYVTVTGCSSATANLNATITPLPAAPAIASNTPICAGNAINLTANTIAGATYVWAGPNAFASGAEDPTIASATVAMSGNYTAYVVVNACTSATSTTPVVVNATPATPVIASNSPVCAGSALNLTSNTINGATYNWTGPNGFTSAAEDPTIASATVAATGAYNLYVTVLGCSSATATLNATVNPIPAAPAIASNTPVCVGNAINLTSNTIAGATYVWTGPNAFTSASEDPTINPAAIANGGNYSAYVVVAGCTSATSVTPVAVNPIPAAPTIASNSPVCTGGTINLTANTIAGATYVWNGPNAFASAAEDPTLTPAVLGMAGNYNAYVVVLGCTSATATTPVLVNQTPALPTAGSNTPVCEGNAINLTANTVVGGTYYWTGPNGYTSSTEDPTIAAGALNMAGNYSVYIVMSGCTSATANTAVAVNPTPVATFAVTPQVCLGDDAFALYGGTAPANATYTWQTSNSPTVTGMGQGPITITWGTAGPQTMTLTVTQNGCPSAPVTHNVNVIAPVQPDAGPDQTMCSGANINVGAQNQPAATYTWLTPNGITNPAAEYSPASWVNNGNAPLTVNLTLQADNQGCLATDNAVITIIPNPTASFNAPGPQCFDNNSFDFTAGGTFMPTATFQWTFVNSPAASSTVQNPQDISFSTPGANDVTLVITQSGCVSAPFTLPVTVMPGPVADFSHLPVAGCSPLTVNFTDLTVSQAGGITYSWNFGNGGGVSNQGSPSYTYTQPGVYSVSLTVNDNTGCTSTITKNNIIRVYDNPKAGFTTNPHSVYIDAPVVNIYDGAVGDIATWHYSVQGGGEFYVPEFTMNFSDTGSYTITQTVTSPEGCTDVFEQVVQVKPITLIYVPNVFTPGGKDNLNNVFKPAGVNINGYKMYIYNRWGEMLFSTADIDEGWDGQVRNSSVEAKQDLYVYKIEYLDHRGNPQQMLGNVMVLR